jgi:CSLREA domain-containing protein
MPIRFSPFIESEQHRKQQNKGKENEIKMKTISLTLLAIFANLVFAAAASAATYNVTKTADSNDGTCDADCSLREAVAAANATADNDTIEFDAGVFAAPQTIILGGMQLIVSNNGTLTINGPEASELTISGNNVTRVFLINVGANAVINAVKITSGSSNFGGGFVNLGNLTVNNVTVTGNTSVNGGGGFRVEPNSTTTINSSIVSNNSSVNGGGIDSFGNAAININDSTVSGNTAANASGGVANTGTLIANDSIFSDNRAVGFTGGGIGNFGTATINGSTIRSNSAPGNSGGGVYSTSGGSLTVTDSTISGNSTGGNGGGVRIFNGTATFINSTVSGNTANGHGGGISNSGSATVSNSTLVDNVANNGGGISVVLGSTANLNNTIIADSPAGGDCFNVGSTINAEYSLIEDGLACVNGTNSNNLTGDPNLGPLQNNGGPTFTHALLVGSIAIDAGNSTLTTDQRGSARPVDNPSIPNALSGNGSDIGSFELLDSDGDGIPDICDIDQAAPGAVDFDRDGIVDGSACDTSIGPPVDKDQCKEGGWVHFNSPTFRNQGDCVSFVVSNRP